MTQNSQSSQARSRAITDLSNRSPHEHLDDSNQADGSRPVDGWLSHIRGTVLLGTPLVIAQLAQTMLNVTNTLVLGRLGPAELGASLIGWQLFYVIWMFGSGFGFAVMPLVANAIGAGAPEQARRYVQMGIWISFIYAVVMLIPLWNAERIFLVLGQDPHISSLAADYTRVLQWSLFPQLTIILLRSFMGALERPAIIVVALVAGGILNACLSIGFVFGSWGLPAMGMAGAGLATFISTSAIAVFLVAYVHWHPRIRRFEVFVRFWSGSLSHLLDVFRLGWPIGATVVAEVALFSASSFMMGWIGATELAAHGIAVQLSGLAFMVPLGLSAAVTIRVGLAYGRRDAVGVTRSVMTGYGLGILFACLSALTFFLFPRQLTSLYLDLATPEAAQVLPFAISFLAIAGVFQIVDSVQALASGSLRGLKDTRIPMFIAILSYWGIGVPVGYALAFSLGWQGAGIWWGLALGLATSALLLSLRLRKGVRSLFHFDPQF